MEKLRIYAIFGVIIISCNYEFNIYGYMWNSTDIADKTPNHPEMLAAIVTIK